MKHVPSKYLWYLLLALVLLPVAGVAQKGEVGISADHLTSDSQGRYALFSGNVRITRDGAVLKADSVQLHYEDGKQKGDTTKGLSLIEAEGNVTMDFEEKHATADKAMYDLRKEEVTLTGGPPRVVSGKSTLTGKTIVINRLTGAIKVDSGNSTRVKVRLVPGEKGFSFTPDKKDK